MKKILVIGNSGSGKTWFSRQLSTVLDMSHFSMDDIFWLPGGYNQKRDDSGVSNELEKISAAQGWVVEGVFGHLAERLVMSADMLLFFDLPWDECRKNLLNRGSESSSQLDPAKAEENFQALLEWAALYEQRNSKASKKFHSFLFENFNGNKHRLCNRNDIERFLEVSSCGGIFMFKPM